MTDDLMLLSCPFCGASAEMVVDEDEDGRFAAVACPKCGAGSRQHYFCGEDAREYAADAWNTRPTALERQASPGGVEEMAGVIEQHVKLSAPSFDISRPREPCGFRDAAQALVAAGYVKAPSVDEMADDIFEHVEGDGFGGVGGRYEAAQAILNRMRGVG